MFKCIYYTYWLVDIVFLGVFGFRNRFNFVSFSLFESTCFREVSFFLQLWHIDSPAGHLGFRFQFAASQYLQFRSLNFSFGLVLYCPLCVNLCMVSCWTSFYRFDIRASGMVLFLFFRLYVFCCICSTTIGISQSFSFSSLSRKFLSVIDAIKFDISNSLLKSGKSHSFSNSNNFSQWSSGVSVAVCFAQKKSFRQLYFFVSLSNICCIFWFFFLFYHCPNRLSFQIVWFDA